MKQKNYQITGMREFYDASEDEDRLESIPKFQIYAISKQEALFKATNKINQEMAILQSNQSYPHTIKSLDAIEI